MSTTGLGFSGEAAGHYARHRPGYPPVIDALVEKARTDVLPCPGTDAAAHGRFDAIVVGQALYRMDHERLFREADTAKSANGTDAVARQRYAAAQLADSLPAPENRRLLLDKLHATAGDTYPEPITVTVFSTP